MPPPTSIGAYWFVEVNTTSVVASYYYFLGSFHTNYIFSQTLNFLKTRNNKKNCEKEILNLREKKFFFDKIFEIILIIQQTCVQAAKVLPPPP